MLWSYFYGYKCIYIHEINADKLIFHIGHKWCNGPLPDQPSDNDACG